MRTKKGWLDYLYYKINNQRNFGLAGLEKLEDGEIKAFHTSYHKAVFPVDYNEDWKLKGINQREILPCEVVLDFDNGENLKAILEKLRDLAIKFYAYSTGSRGYHISLFLDKDLKSEEKLSIIKFFDADEQLSNKHMIALEFAPHWKSHKIKEAVAWK